MFSHENCKHAKTKVARAACRREHSPLPEPRTAEGSQARHPAGKARGGRLPSMIAPKLRPLVDHARQIGLKIRVMTDAPDGVEQGFIIYNPKRTDCELIAEAFTAARKGAEGRAEFFHVEGGRSRQLSKARALADINMLAKNPR